MQDAQLARRGPVQKMPLHELTAQAREKEGSKRQVSRGETKVHAQKPGASAVCRRALLYAHPGAYPADPSFSPPTFPFRAGLLSSFFNFPYSTVYRMQGWRSPVKRGGLKWLFFAKENPGKETWKKRKRLEIPSLRSSRVQISPPAFTIYLESLPVFSCAIPQDYTGSLEYILCTARHATREISLKALEKLCPISLRVRQVRY